MFPEIVPGVLGAAASELMLIVMGALLPQSFFAITLISPLLGPVVTSIEFVLLDPDHPDGMLHIYSVTVGSLVTE
ncbi:hypothetical protein GCM10023115_26800 [Pontixanthobacter gangjinensis]